MYEPYTMYYSYDESLTLINLLLFICGIFNECSVHIGCVPTHHKSLIRNQQSKRKYSQFQKLTDRRRTYQINFNFNTLLITEHKAISTLPVIFRCFPICLLQCCCCYITIAMFSRYFISPKQMVHTITSLRVREVGFYSAFRVLLFNIGIYSIDVL